MAALGLCVALAASASAVTIERNYDGSYDPASATPPAGQSTWTVVTTGGLAIVPNSPEAGVAKFPDNSTTGRIQMSNLLSTLLAPASLGYFPDVFLAEWEYSIRMSVTGPGYPRTLFGIRDEGTTVGRNIMFAHASTGANLFYVVDSGGAVMGTNLYTSDETHPTLGDGQMHDYRVVKRNDAGTMVVDFYLDGTLCDTRPYGSFALRTTPDNGAGIWTATPGTSDYAVDSVHFSMNVPEKLLPTTEQQVSEAFRYDGTYAANDPAPPAGQSTWGIVTTGAVAAIQPNTPSPGVAKLLDNDTAGRFAMNHAITDAALVAHPENCEWTYRFDLACNSVTANPVVFGIRDEGGMGRVIMFGHSATGDLFYASNPGAALPGAALVYTVGTDGPALNDGAMHSYQVVKDVKPGEGIDVRFYLDGILIDTRDYYLFEPDDTARFAAAGAGFGIFGSTPGKADYVIDEVYFGAVPEPGAVVLVLSAMALLWLIRVVKGSR